MFKSRSLFLVLVVSLISLGVLGISTQAAEILHYQFEPETDYYTSGMWKYWDGQTPTMNRWGLAFSPSPRVYGLDIYVDGLIGKGVHFDGGVAVGGAFVQENFPDTTALNAMQGFSLEICVKPEELNREQALVTSGSFNGLGLEITNGNKFRCWMLPTGAGHIGINSTSDVQIGQWTYVVATYDKVSGEVKLYINGGLEATQTGVTVNFTNSSIYIATHNGDEVRFKGTIDEVRISDVALTAQEMAARANVYFPPPPPTLEERLSALEERVLALESTPVSDHTHVEADITDLGDYANKTHAHPAIEDEIDFVIGKYNVHTHDKGSSGRNTSGPTPKVQ